MVFSFTNSRGVEYFVHQGKAKLGKPKYFISKSHEHALQQMPTGYEVGEDINGVAYIRKKQVSLIPDEDLKLVTSACESLKHLRAHRVAAKKNMIIIYGPISATLEDWMPECPLKGLGGREPSEAVMRFVQLKGTDEYCVERKCFRGEVEWLPLAAGPLSALTSKYVRHLGKASFYELI
jgi:hypothetical protein